MGFSIKDITSGISWANNGHFYFNPINKSNCRILVEYLNDISPGNIVSDIKLLSELDKIIKINDKKLINDYIMTVFNGFTQYDDGLYVFITGSTDMSPSVLFDSYKNTLFLIHPNFSIKEKFFISPLDLIELLKFKQKLISIFQDQ